MPKTFKQQVYQDWIDQARHTIHSAKNDQNCGDTDWACFKAQQGAEFVLKALLHGLGLPAFGHSITQLITDVHDSVPSLNFDKSCAIYLDKLYIPTRYPDAFPAGAPHTFYIADDAKKAIDCAEVILGKVRFHHPFLSDVGLPRS